MEESDRIENIMYQIITDRRFISIVDDAGIEYDYLVRSLNAFEIAYSNFIYQKSFSKAKQAGALTEKYLMADAISKGLWNEDKEKLIEVYAQEIIKLRQTKKLYPHNKGRQIKIDNDVKKVLKKLKDLENERDDITSSSAENAASLEKTGYIISRAVLTVDGKQLWQSYSDYLQETDSTLVSKIIVAYSRLPRVEEKEYRKIARMPMWNIIWNTAKNTGSLFDKTISSMSQEQINLCYWSMLYDSVYESLERPSDGVIENDDALDKWFDDQKEKRKKERNARKSNSKMDKHPEVFVMATGDEEADSIYDMNDKWSLAQIQQEAKRLENKAGEFVSEYELRKDRIAKEALLRKKER